MTVVLRCVTRCFRDNFNGSTTNSESCARQMVFYLSYFAGASPNNSQMSHLITRPTSYVIARSLAARNAPSTSSCHIFFTNARIRKDTWRNASDRISRRILPHDLWSAWSYFYYVPIFQMKKKIIKRFVSARNRKERMSRSVHISFQSRW